MPINDDTSNSALVLSNGRRNSENMNNETNVAVGKASDQIHQDNTSAFPFLKLPAELRVQVYRYLLHARYDIFIYSSEAMTLRSLRPHNVNNLSEDGETDGNTYRVMTIRLHPAILSVNRQTYQEASRILYSENRFSFSSNDFWSCVNAIAAVIPFFEDRSEGSRRLIKKIQYVYVDAKSVGFSRWFGAEQDRVFARTCDYLGRNLQLQHVTLRYFLKSTSAPCTRIDFRMYNANINKHDWMQRLLPFAKKLELLAVIGQEQGKAAMVHAAQRYFDEEKAEASKILAKIRSHGSDLIA